MGMGFGSQLQYSKRISATNDGDTMFAGVSGGRIRIFSIQGFVYKLSGDNARVSIVDSNGVVLCEIAPCSGWFEFEWQSPGVHHVDESTPFADKGATIKLLVKDTETCDVYLKVEAQEQG